LRRKKTGFEIAEICGGFGQIPSFLLLKPVYEGRHIFLWKIPTVATNKKS
jgi:hypothetical protein